MERIMISDLNAITSNLSKRMSKSAIRELLKLTKRKDIISFAGGLPAPDSFPVEQVKELSNLVLEKEGAIALQYGLTEGDDLLREELVKRYKSEGANLEKENLVITTSSQQALDFLGKIFINPGDKVVVGLPSYLGALQAFGVYGPEFVGITFDESGMRSDVLEEKLAEMKKNGEKPKFIYIIPDFQNPAGITMPEKRRLEIIEIAKKYGVLIVEDSPYRELRFEGKAQRTMFQLDNDGNVITLGTFSKIFAPGFRIGWVLANEEIIDKFVTIKQSSDLCTSPFVQKIAAQYIAKGYFDENLQKIISMYKEKRDIMLEALKEFMPKDVSWTHPEGGLFLFLKLPEKMDARELFDIALKKNVAFVIGEIFHCDNSGKNTIRLNFSFASKEDNREGIKRLAQAIKEMS